MFNINRKMSQDYSERIQYKFVQPWPKEGVFPKQAFIKSKNDLGYQKHVTCPELKLKKHSEIFKLDYSKFSRENSFCSIDSSTERYGPSITNSPPFNRKRIFNSRKFSRSNILEDDTRRHTFETPSNQHIEIYHLPPMLLPSIHKTKNFDFKALKKNQPPSPPIDPFFFSFRARRRRAANQKELNNNKQWVK